MAQIARNLSDAVAGPLRGFGHLIVDRDPLYTEPFKRLLAAADVHLLRLPAHSPNLNATRNASFDRSGRECLRHIIPLGVRHLRHAIDEFVVHYHSERNHHVIPFPSRDPSGATGRIRRHERLGGLLKFYERKAA